VQRRLKQASTVDIREDKNFKWVEINEEEARPAGEMPDERKERKSTI